MKKISYIAVVAGAVLTGCANNGLVEQVQTIETVEQSSPICIAAGVNNAVRSAVSAQDARHYEFGVYAFKGDAEDAANTVMSNYLVGWGGNSLYEPLQPKANPSTWGDAGSQTDGKSLWFYEGLSAQVKTDYKQAERSQIIKYWDEKYYTTTFYAYAPFSASMDAVQAYNPSKVTYSDGVFTYSNLASFYTAPEDDAAAKGAKHQTAADIRRANAAGAVYDDEMLNYNEALYSTATVSLPDYDKDVRLEFKHINAKLNIAFYETIDGYSVELTDMIPDTIRAAESFNPAVAKAVIPEVPKQNGIVLTPATLEQTTAMAQPAEALLPNYVETATDVTATIGDEGAASLNVAGKVLNRNFYFKECEGILGTKKSDMLRSATWLYVLPNVEDDSYIVDGQTEQGQLFDLEKTGYTLHVSYRLIPDDASANMQVYDARVWIPADKCRWEAGKAYTYVFNITSSSNGSTNPYKLDPDPDKQGEGEQEFWADPRDPRVDDEPALRPIVFDCVMVQDYDEAESSELEISPAKE